MSDDIRCCTMCMEDNKKLRETIKDLNDRVTELEKPKLYGHGDYVELGNYEGYLDTSGLPDEISIIPMPPKAPPEEEIDDELQD